MHVMAAFPRRVVWCSSYTQRRARASLRKKTRTADGEGSLGKAETESCNNSKWQHRCPESTCVFEMPRFHDGFQMVQSVCKTAGNAIFQIVQIDEHADYRQNAGVDEASSMPVRWALTTPPKLIIWAHKRHRAPCTPAIGTIFPPPA